jgi:hypothetical protein
MFEYLQYVSQLDATLVAVDSGPAAAVGSGSRNGGRRGADRVLKITQRHGDRRDSRRSLARSPDSHASGGGFCAKLMRELSTDGYSM